MPSPSQFVLGIDSSTTATKAVAWSPAGEALAEGRCEIPLSTPAAGRYEQDPTDWWGSTVTALKQLGAKIDMHHAAALAIANQRETVGFFDADGKAVAPAIVWLDERARETVDSFAAEVGDAAIHRITGKHKDVTPVIYRLAWLRKYAPEVCRAATRLSDVQGYLVKRLCGAFATSWASADPMGCWDIARKCWSAEILDALEWGGDAAEIFPPAHRPGARLGTVSAAAARATGLREGLPVIAGGGDGQCAGLGVGVTRAGNAYLNLGTAVVCGAYQTEYAYGDAWRTMTAMNADADGGYIMESCLRAGTFLLNWWVETVFGGADFAELEAEAAELAPGADGLRLLPYWSGVMNPHWDSGARGAIFGLAGGHGRAHLYRAVLEGIALDQADCMRRLQRETGGEIARYYAVGGGAQSDLWCRMFADCLRRPVCRLDTLEASALGAGIAAAAGVGWYASLEEAAEAMGGEVTARFEPGGDADVYARLLAGYPGLYSTAVLLTPP